MYIAFVDEAGFEWNWKAGIEAQPFYVLSAVMLPCEKLSTLYKDARDAVGALKLPGQAAPLGIGFEIKGKDIAQGKGWWREQEKERNAVRDLMLTAPAAYGGAAIIAVIDKQRHLNKYAYPEDPALLAATFVLERVGQFLYSKEDFAYCVYDRNERFQAPLTAHTNRLLAEGSSLEYVSAVYGPVQAKIQLDRILEVAGGYSECSVGLQISDFFASMTYQYYKQGCPSDCGWWKTIEASLHNYKGKTEGFGLKLFP